MQVLPGETMFAYLRRKKRQISSIESELRSSNMQSTKRQQRNRSMIKITGTPQDFKSTKRNILQQQQEIQNIAQSITKFDEPEPKHNNNKSFIQLISPLHCKKNQQKQYEINNFIQQKKDIKQNKLIKTSINYHSNNKNKILQNIINQIKQLIQRLQTNAKIITNKTHSLFIEIKPIFRFLKNCSNTSIQKKIDEVNSILISLEKSKSHLDSDKNLNLLDRFHNIFSEHLNTIQSEINSNFVQDKELFQKKIRQQTQEKIEQFKSINLSLQRDIQILQKKIEKFNKEAQNKSQKATKSHKQLVEDYTYRLQNSEKMIQKLLQQNKQLQEQLQIATTSEQQQNKLIQQLNREKQEQGIRDKQQQMKICSQREQFLLQEVIVIKQQCRKDITYLMELHQEKTGELQNKINRLQKNGKICEQKLQQTIENNLKLQQKIRVNYNNYKKMNRQNQCLITDMHRINQQLYQHWLAIKDIKILLSRLDLFDKFERIYHDLAFNQHLFS